MKHLRQAIASELNQISSQVEEMEVNELRYLAKRDAWQFFPNQFRRRVRGGRMGTHSRL